MELSRTVDGVESTVVIPFTLRAGSALVLRGEARTLWRHGISRNVTMPALDYTGMTPEERDRYPDRKRPLNYRRVSLTFRHVDA